MIMVYLDHETTVKCCYYLISYKNADAFYLKVDALKPTSSYFPLKEILLFHNFILINN